ncbi:Major Facilitator Superfamily protein [Kytococcus aerolatus]|uniref:Major Facilitator Superfamily protein n=1 Tax=Kytococcus aerolatus TaxID=592308 RepID=A0A212U4X5_9MICO|nr:MFS transporter [Kytococcus aerolatus]SNC73308.1 Major Facilitator Superfamily protein [Kytococcus aerolatus]
MSSTRAALPPPGVESVEGADEEWAPGSTERILRVPDVRRVITGRALTVGASRMLMVALMLWVEGAGFGAVAMAAVMVSVALPPLFFMATAGDTADQYDSRRVLVLGTAVQVVGALAVTAAVLWAPRELAVPLVVAMAFLFQTGSTFSQPVWDALVPRIVGEERVGAVFSWQQGASSISGPLGAGIGGVVFGLVSGAAALGMTTALTASILVPALLLRTRRGGPADELLRESREEARRAAAEHGPWARFWRRTPFGQVSRGVGVLRTVPAAAVIATTLFAFIVAQGASNVVEVFLVRGPIGASEAEYGISEAFAAIGGVAGAWATAKVVSPSKRVHVLVAGLALGGFTLLWIGMAPSFWFYAAGQVALGVMQAMVVSSAVTVTITSAPEERRGAVLAGFSGVTKMGTVCALCTGAVVGSLLEPRTAFLVLGTAALVLLAATGWRLPGISRELARQEAAQREEQAGAPAPVAAAA